MNFIVVELKPVKADVKERKKKDDSSNEPKQKRTEKIALKDSSDKDDAKVSVMIR